MVPRQAGGEDSVPRTQRRNIASETEADQSGEICGPRGSHQQFDSATDTEGDKSMRKIGKWALTLGLLSAFPGLTLAAEPQPSASRSTASADKSTNQKAAEDIAKALRAARIKGEGIEIEYRDGVATLRGTVAEPEMRQRAEMATSRVPGIQSVKNELRAAMPVASKSGGDPFLAESRVTQASFDGDGRGNRVQPVDYAPTEGAPGGNNQEVAEQIAASMSAAQLRGYDIEVMYQDGVCSLVGSVPTNAQRMAAELAARAVPAVRAVRNNLRTTQEPTQPAHPGMAGHPGMGGPGMPPAGIHPAAYQPGAMGPGGPMGPGVAVGSSSSCVIDARRGA